MCVAVSLPLGSLLLLVLNTLGTFACAVSGALKAALRSGFLLLHPLRDPHP